MKISQIAVQLFLFFIMVNVSLANSVKTSNTNLQVGSKSSEMPSIYFIVKCEPNEGNKRFNVILYSTWPASPGWDAQPWKTDKGYSQSCPSFKFGVYSLGGALPAMKIVLAVDDGRKNNCTSPLIYTNGVVKKPVKYKEDFQHPCPELK